MILIIMVVSAAIGATAAYVVTVHFENEKSKYCPLSWDSHWQTFRSDNGEYHTVPFYDSMTHTISDTCLCFPETEYKDSIGGWVITHLNEKERNNAK